jgi:hypothetical protein
MRSGRIVPLLLSIFVTFLLLPSSPTLAGTINVLGSLDFAGLGFAARRRRQRRK